MIAAISTRKPPVVWVGIATFTAVRIERTSPLRTIRVNKTPTPTVNAKPTNIVAIWANTIHILVLDLRSGRKLHFVPGRQYATPLGRKNTSLSFHPLTRQHG